VRPKPECQRELFNLPLGEQLKEVGIQQAVEPRDDLLGRARQIGRAVAIERGTVTADDVQRRLIAEGSPPLGNAAGALFRGHEWEFTGQWKKSARVSNHARQNRVWRLVGRL